MAKEEIVFRMHPDGKREIEANGFVGKACEKATAAMMKELGKRSGEKRKPCYNQTEQNKNIQTQW